MFLCAAATAAVLLGGLLPQTAELETRWPIAGRWLFPVGDPRDYTEPAGPEGPGYAVTRNLGGPSRHLGADLSNRRAGGAVRAAAHGVVVATAPEGGNGYGIHVVLAHRLPSGDIVFSVYAHLVRGTVTVRPGKRVVQGELLGRVGDTGDATSPHLHFEVRAPRDPLQRWEKAEAVDPIAFVKGRLPEARSDTGWARAYLDWSEGAGLTADPLEPAQPITRGQWRLMLVAAVSSPGGAERNPVEATARLQAQGVLAADCALDPLETVDWTEVVRDIRNVGRTGVRLPPFAAEQARHRERCRQQLGCESPAASLGRIARRHQPPSAAEVFLVLADLTFE